MSCDHYPHDFPKLSRVLCAGCRNSYMDRETAKAPQTMGLLQERSSTATCFGTYSFLVGHDWRKSFLFTENAGTFGSRARWMYKTSSVTAKKRLAVTLRYCHK